MKKKLLLGLLPAVLVLASCQASPRVEPKPNLDNIVEDTEAHDEIFGKSVLSGDLAIRKTYDGDVVIPEDTGVAYPNLGIQTKKDNGADGIADTSDDTISIRLVAAIQIGDVNGDSVVNDADLAATTVTWTRTIFGSDGTVSIASAMKSSTRAYTSLAAPSDVEGDATPDNILTIDEFNDQKDGRAYTHFVVYTLLDLPLTYGDYYVVADISVNDGASEILATTIDQTTQFVFEPYVNAHPLNNHYFAVKKTAAGFDVIDPAATPGDGNLAKFEGVALNADEKIVLIHRVVNALGSNEDLFEVFDYDDRGDNGNYFFAAETGMAKLNYKATYTFALTTGKKINISATNIVRKLYVSLADPSVDWWEGTGVFTALFAYVYGVGGHWYTLTKVSDHLYITDEVVDPTEYDRAIVGRIDNSIKNDDSSTWWDSGKVYNQTQGDEDAPLFPHSTTHDHAYVKRANEWSPLYIEWWD